MKKSILFVADTSPIYSGQAVISKAVYKLFKKNYKIFHVRLSYTNNNHTSLIYKILFFYRLIFQTMRFCLQKNEEKIIYFTPSRGHFSVIRDVAIILLLRVINKNNMNIYAHLHGSDMKKSIDRSIFKNFLYYSYYRLKINIIILSHGQKKFALGSKYKNYLCIPNFISSAPIKKYKIQMANRDLNFKNLSIKESKISFVHLSGLSANKGLDFSILFIQYLNELNIKDTTFHLDAIGWERNEFISLFPQLTDHLVKLEDKKLIKFHGKIKSKSKINKFLSSTHFNILLSKNEAQPLSIIEGASLGCFSVVNNVDFISDLLKKIKGKAINRNKIKQEAIKFKKFIENIDKDYFSLDKVRKRNKVVLESYSKSNFDNLFAKELI